MNDEEREKIEQFKAGNRQVLKEELSDAYNRLGQAMTTYNQASDLKEGRDYGQLKEVSRESYESMNPEMRETPSMPKRKRSKPSTEYNRMHGPE